MDLSAGDYDQRGPNDDDAFPGRELATGWQHATWREHDVDGDAKQLWVSACFYTSVSHGACSSPVSVAVRIHVSEQTVCKLQAPLCAIFFPSLPPQAPQQESPDLGVDSLL